MGSGISKRRLPLGRVEVAPDGGRARSAPASETGIASEDELQQRVLRNISSKRLTLDDFTNPASLFSLLGPHADLGGLAPVALLSGKWLLRRAAALRDIDRAAREAMALPCRQDLELTEPSAFLSAEALASLPRGDARIGGALPLICVSHCWHGKEHPDPYGDNLLVLADAIEERIDGALPGTAPATEFAVFLDWCSLHQRGAGGTERRPNERAAFGVAISRMQLWYAHQKTLVYLLTATPAEWTGAAAAAGDVAVKGAHVPYEGRGWPTFERTVSMLIKEQSSKCWATIVDVGSGSRKPQPPRTPSSFDALVTDPRALAFTNGADRRVVSELYAVTITAALGQARSLRYAGLHWGDAEMAELVKVLPLCHRLEDLNLKGSHNRYTAASAAMLAGVLRATDARSGGRYMPMLRALGAGCAEIGAPVTAEHEPLLGDAGLREVCRERAIALERDVPLATRRSISL
jgi:hypothetical protein